MSTTVASTEKIIVPVDKNDLPTSITIRKQPNGLYRWIGNDGSPYSPEDNHFETLARLAVVTGLTKQ